jgi:imidazolonepropionase-like amidohydrolase
MIRGGSGDDGDGGRSDAEEARARREARRRRRGSGASTGKIVALCLLLLLVLFILAACGPGPGEGATLVVRGGTLVDGTGAEPLEGSAVVMEDGRITAVGPAGEVEAPAGAREIDATGRYVLPGYVDAHVHFSQTGWFDGRPDAADVRDRHPYPSVVAGLKARPERFYGAYLCSGVTSTFDVGGYPWTRDLQERGERDPGAVRVSAAGPLLSTVDFWLNLPGQRQFVHMSSDSVVRRTVRSHAQLGSAALKVWYITPSSWTAEDSARYSERVHVAGAAADSVGLPFIVHATGLWEAKDALRAGAEVLVHSVFDDPVDREFLELAAENGVIYVPTLTVTEGYANAFLGKSAEEMPYPAECVDPRTKQILDSGLAEGKRPPWARGPDAEAPENAGLRRGIENLGKVHEAGITVATGTDAGNPGTVHGPSLFREMELMARAGMSPREVIVATTRNGARALGRSQDLGTVEEGKKADLVILARSPLEDLAAASTVLTVVKDGRVVWGEGRREGAAEAP